MSAQLRPSGSEGDGRLRVSDFQKQLSQLPFPPACQEKETGIPLLALALQQDTMFSRRQET